MYKVESFGFEVLSTNNKSEAVRVALEYVTMGTDADIIDVATNKILYALRGKGI